MEVESRGGKQKLLAKKDPKIPLPTLAYPMWVEWVEQACKSGMMQIASPWNPLVIAVELKTKTKGNECPVIG